MLHQPVASSNVRSVGYSEDDLLLEIAFHHGGLYQYARVPAHVHAALMASPSKGRYVARFIKNHYAVRKVG